MRATILEIELHEAKIDAFDIEAAINFATDALRSAACFWIGCTLEQKLRFQRILFPEGRRFDGENFRTAKTCLIFNYLREISPKDSSLASRTGVEPRLVGVAAVKEKRFIVITMKLSGMDRTLSHLKGLTLLCKPREEKSIGLHLFYRRFCS